MIYLVTDEVIRLHALVIQQSGGSPGIRDRNLIDSAVYQPQATFAPVDEQERVFLDLAAGSLSRPDFTHWVQTHIVPIPVVPGP